MGFGSTASLYGGMARLVERTKAETSFERIEPYPEYPGREHPMRQIDPKDHDYDGARGEFVNQRVAPCPMPLLQLRDDGPEDMPDVRGAVPRAGGVRY